MALFRISLCLPTAQLLIAKIHPSENTRKDSFFSFLLSSVALFFPYFLDLSQILAAFSPLPPQVFHLSFYKLYVTLLPAFPNSLCL